MDTFSQISPPTTPAGVTRDLCFMDDGRVIGRHGSLLVRPNDFPIGCLSLLLVSAQHREQILEEDIRSALSFASSFARDYLVYHNMRNSGATRPEHVHFQAVLREEKALPIEVAPRQELFRLDGATVVARVEEYPVYSLAAKGKRASETALVILGEIFLTSYNLVMSNEEIIIVPRTKERPSSFNTLFGGLEMAGCVVLVEEERYQKLDYNEIWQALSECGWSHKEGERLEEKLYRALGEKCQRN